MIGLFRPTRRKLTKAAIVLVFTIGTVAAVKSILIVAISEDYSMYPTVMDGEIVVAMERWKEPELRDLVLVEMDGLEDFYLLKRLSGVPGSSVKRNGTGPSLTLGEDEYWLTSSASRYVGHANTRDSNDFGPVGRGNIKGVVVWKSAALRWALAGEDTEARFMQAKDRRR